MQAILYFENGCLRMTLNFLTSLFWECLYIGWECLYTGLVSVHWLSVCTLADQRKSRQWRHEFKLSRLKKVVLHGLTCLQSIISTSETPYEGGGLTEVLVHSLTKESQGDDVTQRSKLSGLWTLPFLRTAHTLDQHLHLQYSTKL